MGQLLPRTDREALHQILVECLGNSSNVYFQPPANIKMNYPAIVYQRDREARDFAGNNPYRIDTRYQVTIIDRDPDSPIPRRVASLPKSNFVRFFVVDNLNHDIYSLYY